MLWASVRQSGAGRLETPNALAQAAGAQDSASDEDAASSSATRPASLDPAQIQACLTEHGGSIEPTWRALNLTSRHVLVRLIKKHGLSTR